MTVIAFASVKGSPGVTTLATAVAAGWPPGQRVVLAELDPTGGDLALRFGQPLNKGLATLAVAARRGALPDLIWQHAQPLTTDLEVLAGPADAGQAEASIRVLADTFTEALKELASNPKVVVLMDCGTLTANAPVLPLLREAQQVVLVTRGDPDELAHLHARIPHLKEATEELVFLLARPKGYASSEIAAVLGLPYRGSVPVDRRCARALKGRARIRWWWLRTPLLRFAARLASRLAAELEPVRQAVAKSTRPAVPDEPPAKAGSGMPAGAQDEPEAPTKQRRRTRKNITEQPSEVTS